MCWPDPADLETSEFAPLSRKFMHHTNKVQRLCRAFRNSSEARGGQQNSCNGRCNTCVFHGNADQRTEHQQCRPYSQHETFTEKRRPFRPPWAARAERRDSGTSSCSFRCECRRTDGSSVVQDGKSEGELTEAKQLLKYDEVISRTLFRSSPEMRFMPMRGFCKQLCD